MVKIAVELEQALAQKALSGVSGQATERKLAGGRGWDVADVLCTSGPQDRPFEELHNHYSVAVVAAGTFQYRSSAGTALMTPGSLLLGTAGAHFECAHDHGAGDRCIAFRYSPEYFEKLVSQSGIRSSKARFSAPRVPPVKAISTLVARALTGTSGMEQSRWEELAIMIAARAIELANGGRRASDDPPSAVARVTRVVRRVERQPDDALTLNSLADEAGLSPYHFLRVFESLTGVTPHQYIVRARLREAAFRLSAEPDKILDVALDCGFADISNFNRAFRAEFGTTPRDYRRLRGNRLRRLPW